MKKPLIIKRVEFFAVGDPNLHRPRWADYCGNICTTDVICKITTEDGYEGIGGTIGYTENRFDPSALEVAKLFVPGLIGKSAIDREAIWAHMAYRPTAFKLPTISVIDIALWDLVGKYARLPIYQMIGGARDKILAYASTPLYETHKEYFDYIDDCMKQGFTAVKIHPHAQYDSDVLLVDAIQKKYAGKMKFMLDSDCQYNREEALKMALKLSDYDWLWFEAPLPDRDITGYKYLMSKASVPVNTGGWVQTSLMDINEGLKQDAWTDARTDVTVIGGFTPTIKVMHLCEAYNKRCELQSWGTPLVQAANLHMALAVHNCSFYEQPYPYENFEFDTKTVFRIDKDGFVHAPQGHGLGVEMDWEAVEKLCFARYDSNTDEVLKDARLAK